MESLTLPFLGHTEGDAASGHLGYSFGTSAASANRHYVPETLKSLHIRRGRSLAPSAFLGCVALREIDLPSELTSIGSEAFSGCVSLTAVKIGKNVSSIGERAFSGCNGVLTVTVDGQNTTYHSEGNCLIETSAKTLLFGCRRSVIPSDGSVKIIASYAFEGCTGLSAITLPDELYLIQPYAFLGCDSLTTVTFEVAHRWLISLSSDYSQPMAQYTVDEAQNAASLTDRYVRYYWFQNKIFDEGAQ